MGVRRFRGGRRKATSSVCLGSKAIHFEAFRPYFIPDEDRVSYPELAAGLERTEAAVKVAVHRARRRFARRLRDEVAQTVAASGASPGEGSIDDEARYLLRVLAASRGARAK